MLCQPVAVCALLVAAAPADPSVRRGYLPGRRSGSSSPRLHLRRCPVTVEWQRSSCPDHERQNDWQAGVVSRRPITSRPPRTLRLIAPEGSLTLAITALAIGP